VLEDEGNWRACEYEFKSYSHEVMGDFANSAMSVKLLKVSLL
jgi:hypothetical protein